MFDINELYRLDTVLTRFVQDNDSKSQHDYKYFCDLQEKVQSMIYPTEGK